MAALAEFHLFTVSRPGDSGLAEEAGQLIKTASLAKEKSIIALGKGWGFCSYSVGSPQKVPWFV